MKFTTKREFGAERQIDLDIGDLERELREKIDGEVRFDNGARALYATAAGNYRQVPIGVVIPRNEQAFIQCIGLCRKYGAPILTRGGGTSLAGQCCNVAVVLDASKYLRQIVEIDWTGKRARVQPGVVLDDLRNAAEQRHLTFAPDPSTHNHCTLGGMIGNNSCGVHSVMGGKTVDNVEELRVLTYDGLELRVGATSDEELQRIIAEGGRRGELYAALLDLRNRYGELIRQRFPKIPRRVSGYNLDELLPENGFHVARALVGSEGTCVTVLEATCRLVDSPPARCLAVLGYPDVYIAADSVPEVLASKPIGLEGLDERLVEDIKKKNLHQESLTLLPAGKGWLLAEFGGETAEEARDRAQALRDALKKCSAPPSVTLYDDRSQQEKLWKLRESGLGATANVPGLPLTWEGWEDSAVSPAKLGNYLRELRKLLDSHGYRGDFYGHFGQGCLHTRINFDLITAEGIRNYRSFMTSAAQLVTSFGGSLSGEHGDGQSRAELLPIMFGNEIVNAFREFKRIWDPEWKMNPGKIVDPYRIDENLRLGTDYAPSDPPTQFRFPEDSYSFARAALRCVGVGECRREKGAVMCPSYRATHEEQHSTRGRARLLFEMLQGDVLQKGWREKAVLEALDLCLACKGCRSDCPVNVDMASYKAEFLSHYYRWRLRPRRAYAIGWIHHWSRIAGRLPGVANFFTQTPGLNKLAKLAAGFAPERSIPAYAAQPFTDWFRTRAMPQPDLKGRGSEKKVDVLLWPDTFNNYFSPRVAQDAVSVLETAGCRVQLPRQHVCCGRPMYDYGMLDAARRLLRKTMNTLQSEIRLGIPVIILEPSCAAVFRDELQNLFPNSPDAKRLSQQTFLLSEFLDKRMVDYQPPRFAGRAIVHGHCHHHAIMTMDSERRLLAKMGSFDLLDSGCCGMAGGFGYEKEHYAISRQIGEQILLPAVRSAPEDTVIIADGFSCREQIVQLTNRKALHLAEVLQIASHGMNREGQMEPPAPEQNRRQQRTSKAAL